jgi:single-stranded DNA-binding protein
MASCLRLEQSLEVAKTLQKGQLVTLEGTLRYREVEDEVEGTRFKHRITGADDE